MKKEVKPRHSLNDRINAELASAEEITLAGIDQSVLSTSSASLNALRKGGGEAPQTKKATTIMPKEQFLMLQRFCADTETPKHRAICRFILDGLRAAGQVNEKDYQRLKEEAEKITTTYEKRK
jgi:hypothetical protein